MLPIRRVAFFGPAGTFTEEALLTQSDLASLDLVAQPTIEQVLAATTDGTVDLGFVPIENGIEGTVNATLDGLVFGSELRIIREVVLEVHLNLLGVPGATLGELRQVRSFPHALAQCRTYLTEQLPGVTTAAATSTADAARQVGEDGDPSVAAIATILAASLYGLEVLQPAIEDHQGNQTRFVAVARRGIPEPTGQDRTSIVCFQDADRPGNLYSILGQFAARNINLTKLESRPTKQGLGEYCFVIDLDGHLADEVVADCLAELRATIGPVKFLGSYPHPGALAAQRRAQVSERRASARAWIDALLDERFDDA